MYAIVDIETTGSLPQIDRIIEIAIVLHDGRQIVDSFSSLVNPERYIPEFITRLTGISNEMVEKSPRFYEIAKEIVKFTEGHVFVAHNVHFDYSFLRTEFKNLGYSFQRKTLCTVRLSRKLLPGLPSYSLGKLCRSLMIPLHDRHRAHGDAQATAHLFTLLFETDQKNIQQANLNTEAFSLIDLETKQATLPPNIDHEQFYRLPEKTGVYYFYDQDRSPIYIGKSRSIKTRVSSHFQITNKTRKEAELKNTIASVDYILTGSELIALLLESDEIKKYNPRFNRAQRRTTFRYGIFSRIDGQGYVHFYIDKLKSNKVPVFLMDSTQNARKLLQHYVEKYELCPKLSDLYRHAGACFDYQVKKCKGACMSLEAPEIYNERAQALLIKLNAYGSQPNFIIVGEGRKRGERSIVCIENGRYLGFGYISTKTFKSLAASPEKFKEHIIFYQDTRDTQRILWEYLKNTNDQIIYY